MIQFFYSFALYLLSPLVLLHFWLRGRKAPAYRRRGLERLALVNYRIPPGGIVFHCASVGEVVAATPLIKKIQMEHPQLPIIITCNTPTGSEQISRNFGDRVYHVYLPLDFADVIRRFLDRLQPRLLCILETELWPNLICLAHRREIPVVVVNARLSEKSMNGYRRVWPLTQLIMKHISLLAAHDRADAARFIQLGLDPAKVRCVGSIKFDIQINDATRRAAQQLKTRLAVHSPIWIGASTHGDEHRQLLTIHQRLLAANPRGLLILVPRHPEAFDEVAKAIAAKGLSLLRHSQGRDPHETAPDQRMFDQCQVYLGDTMGDLLVLFGAADMAFIGGSLIARGGHNPLEAAAYGIAVLTGPQRYNFDHVYPELLKAQGCLAVEDDKGLLRALEMLIASPSQRADLGRRAAQFVADNRGAIAKTSALITDQLKSNR